MDPLTWRHSEAMRLIRAYRFDEDTRWQFLAIVTGWA